jgi:predicted NUDIX family NTP pyrophosphohydrolase
VSPAPKSQKISAGVLLYRHFAGQLEVLLVHPSGNYNRNKPWSIPKGLPDEGEAVEAAARRETFEEAGVDVTGPLVELGTIRYQKSGKLIHCFAAAAPDDCSPRCASWEVDRAKFVSLSDAQRLIHPDQQPFLDRLVERLKSI